jgi:hypothetical protein
MIITLCGSAKFEAAFHNWNERLTLDGHIVLSLAVFPSVKGKKDWYSPEIKAMLDTMHKRKISKSEAIFVIDEENDATQQSYIGESTASEIRFAEDMGLPIYYASRLSSSWRNGINPAFGAMTSLR